MVIFFYGTTGESIKLLPLLKNFPEEQTLTISTAQQASQLAHFYADTHTKPAEITIGRKKDATTDLEKINQIPAWAARSFSSFPSVKSRIKKEMKARGVTKEHTVLVVHGDTMTTVVGAMLGRFCGIKVAHVEAGLRSFNWRHPFPEEIDRTIVSKIARIHFAPGAEPIKNLKRAAVKGDIVDTNFNTVLDSLLLAKEANIESPVKHLKSGYCLVSIHRNELLAQPKELEDILKTLQEHSEKNTVVFIEHPVTLARIKELKLEKYLTDSKMVRVPKLSYMQFISVVAKSGYIVTDSGGLQEESSYLGIPCLIHRKATERTEGLDKIAVLSMYDHEKVADFLENHKKFRSGGIIDTIKASKKKFPTEVIRAEFEKRGYL